MVNASITYRAATVITGSGWSRPHRAAGFAARPRRKPPAVASQSSKGPVAREHDQTKTVGDQETSQLLVNQPRHDYGPGTNIFLELNVDRIAAELQLAQKGGERGAQERPAQDAQTPDDVEHRIVERIETHKQDAHSLYLEHLHTYDQRMAALDFEERFAVIRQAAPGGSRRFPALRRRLGAMKLFALRRRVVGSEKEREHFRAFHGLVRTASRRHHWIDGSKDRHPRPHVRSRDCRQRRLPCEI